MCVWSHLSTLLLNYAEVYFLFKLVTQITARREKGGERKIRFKWFKSEGIALATLVVKPVSDLPTSGWISKVFTTWPFRFWDTQVWCAKLARRESNVVLYTCNFRNIKDLLFALKIILTLRQLSDIRKKKKLYQFKWFETYWMFSPNCKLSSVFFFLFSFLLCNFRCKTIPQSYLSFHRCAPLVLLPELLYLSCWFDIFPPLLYELVFHLWRWGSPHPTSSPAPFSCANVILSSLGFHVRTTLTSTWYRCNILNFSLFTCSCRLMCLLPFP